MEARKGGEREKKEEAEGKGWKRRRKKEKVIFINMSW